MSRYRVTIHFPFEDVELRDLSDTEEDARLDAMIAISCRWAEAKALYLSNPVDYEYAEEYCLTAGYDIEKVEG